MTGLLVLVTGIAVVAVVAAKQPIRDVVAGLAARGRYRVHDWVALDSRTCGTVTHIGFCSTRVFTTDGVEVSIPHSAIDSAALVEARPILRRKRVRILFSVLYRADLERVRRRAEMMARTTRGVLVGIHMAPEAKLLRLGEACLELELAVWVAECRATEQVVDDLTAGLYSALLGSVVEVRAHD